MVTTNESGSNNPNAWAIRQRKIEEVDVGKICQTLAHRSTSCAKAIQYLLALSGISELHGIKARFADPEKVGRLSTPGLIAYIENHRDFRSDADFARIVSIVQSTRPNLDNIIALMEIQGDDHEGGAR